MFRWTRIGLLQGIKTLPYPKRPPDPLAVGQRFPRIAHPDEAATLACPMGAIQGRQVDYRRCLACGACGAASKAVHLEPRFDLSWVNKNASKGFTRSLHILHFDAGSDGSEESELAQLSAPPYDLHRLGFFFTPSPRHADLLMVTGSVTDPLAGPLLSTYQAMPQPRWVAALGTDAVSGGLWGGHGIGAYLPVDLEISGSPPAPLAILHALLRFVGSIL